MYLQYIGGGVKHSGTSGDAGMLGFVVAALELWVGIDSEAA